MEAINSQWEKRSGLRPTLKRLLALASSLAVLFKLRIVVLLLLAAVAGAALAANSGGLLTLSSLLLLLVSGSLSAAGASAINQVLEQERDRQMERTRQRPLPSGRFLHSGRILGISVAMVIVAVLLALPFNRSLALFVALGAAIYVGVYTIWLKPRTPLNIVIGGAAGSCAVLSGGAAAGAWRAPGTWLLATLLFTWTPVHFWSLALAYRRDYARAGYPMLPAQVSAQAAARWTALHTALTAVFGLALGLWPSLNLPYLLLAGLATLALAWGTRRLLLEPGRDAALSLFHLSNGYLAIVLLAVLFTGV